MITKKYRDQVLAEIESVGISLELLEVKVKGAPWPDDSRIAEIARLYIASRPLGGTLAVNHGDGWFPVFPQKATFCGQFIFYSPVLRAYPAKDAWPTRLVRYTARGGIEFDFEEEAD